MGFTKEQLKELLMNPERTGSKYMWPENFQYPYEVKEDFIEGFRIETISRKNNLNKHIYFLHGGGYVIEFCQDHVDLIKRMADNGLTITCIDYPLAPEYTAERTIDIVIKGYKKILEKYPEDTFYLFGDSSGGGLAVSLLMMLRDKGIGKRPEKAVLASPWLDLSMSNPKVKDMESKEKVLPLEMAFYISKEYRGGIDAKDPRVSPIYGDLRNLGEILMFYSDSEIMKPDCEIFIDKINKSEGSSIKYFMGKNMIHDYVAAVKNDESDKAFEDIIEFLNKDVCIDKRKELLEV